MTPTKAPNCFKCVHFAVSGDPFLPYVCKTFEIKSRRLPSHEVYLATGRHCPVYQENPNIKVGENEPPMDKKGWLA